VTWDRPILYAKIELPGPCLLHVLNAHLKSKLPTDIFGQKQSRFKWKSASGWAEGFFLSSIKRVGQALQMRRLIDGLFDQDERSWIIACGDFNADSDEVAVEAIRGDAENTGNARLAGRVMVPCEGSIPEPARYTLIHHGKGRMIDHLLASRMLLAHYIGSEIHNELIHDESVKFMSEQEFPESDHAPLIAEFAV
jgi:endonuclease/exonuclease/phosphatase family metal-dependent hydrolase